VAGGDDMVSYNTVPKVLMEHAALTQLYWQMSPHEVDFLNKGLDNGVDREFGDAPWD
jgi:hypothetical protein